MFNDEAAVGPQPLFEYLPTFHFADVSFKGLCGSPVNLTFSVAGQSVPILWNDPAHDIRGSENSLSAHSGGRSVPPAAENTLAVIL